MTRPTRAQTPRCRCGRPRNAKAELCHACAVIAQRERLEAEMPTEGQIHDQCDALRAEKGLPPVTWPEDGKLMAAEPYGSGGGLRVFSMGAVYRPDGMRRTRSAAT